MVSNRIENLPLEWVRTFEAAGRTGSFTAAADELRITQAAVSQRISNLENHIGAQLFTRKARGVVLTIDGEAWLPHVTNTLLSLKHSAEELFGKPLAQVLISASASINQLWIAPRLAGLGVNSNIQISMTTMNIGSDFAKANATVEIKYGNGGWPEALHTQLFKESMTPLVSPSLLSKSKKWQELPIIALSGPRPGWEEWKLHSEEQASLVPRFRFDSFAGAQAAALAGAGVLLGSLPLSKQALKEKALVRVTQKTMNSDAGYWMVANREKLRISQWEELVAVLVG